MEKELIVSSQEDTVQVALLEEGRLMELHQNNSELNFAVGDMYLGKVKKLAPSLNAAFVDIGYSKDAFLHYHDLGPGVLSSKVYTNIVMNGKFKTSLLKTFRKEKLIKKDGTIDQVLAPGDTIMVQITKEPINTKGPRITSEISIAGRYLILCPFSDRVSISQKINSKSEKDRLLALVESIKPEGFGIIIRTAAEEKKVAELHADLSFQMKKWNTAFKNIQKKKIPSKILSEIDLATGILRDTFSEEFVKITVDDKELAEDMKEYLKVIAPDKTKIVKLIENNQIPLFERTGIERQIKFAFGQNVTIPKSKGAYLVIEHTEALHVIDVNSGNISRSMSTGENTALTINKIAASEIARQLRLRDMGGIIVIDFIDMPENAHKRELFSHMKEEMMKDTAKHKILPPSRFGLIQITRQRVRPVLNILTREENPNKEEDKVEAPIIIINRIEQVLKNILETKKEKAHQISLHTHPFIAAYLTKGIPSIRQKWYFKYKKWIKIIPRDAYKYLQFNFLDKNNDTLYNESN